MKDRTQQLLLVYMAQAIGGMPDAWGPPKQLGGFALVSALWPLNDVLRPHLALLGSCPYSSAFEPQADEALEHYLSEGSAALQSAAPGALRVLLERQLQALTVACANEAADNAAVMVIPADLPASALHGAAVVYMLHGMVLPFAPDAAHLPEWPEAGQEPSGWLH